MSLFDSASLVITPNGIKEDKLYAIKPTDGSGDLTVTRATTATRVNSDGLIEVTPYNLLQRSEEFNNAAWTKAATSGGTISVTANYSTAPNGTLTADRLLVTNVVSASVNQSIVSTSGIAYTSSIYLKSNTSSSYTYQLRDGYSGTLKTITVTPQWQRFDLNFTSSGTTLELQLRTLVAGASDISIWGAQLVTGTSAKEYFPTTDRLDIPRLDYTNSSCPSILVEPQRTNLLLRSQEFDNASWIKTSTTITPNTTISPDGTLNADSMVVSSSDSRATQVLALGAGTYTTTVYVKILSQTTAGTMRLQANVDSTNVSVNFTPTTEWQRVTATYNATVGIINFSVRGLGFIGTIAIWGSQLEAGSNATSYIPTVASSVTRNADVISKTGISSLIGQTEGTIFTEFNFTNVGTEKYILNLKDAASSNVISFRRLTSGEIRFVLTATTSSGTTNQSTAVLPNGNYKIAYKYISGSIKIFINGSLSFTLNPTFTFGTPISIIELGNQNAGNQINDSIKQLQLYKTALTDTECIQLTTL
jgi:hypothetical protein